MNFDINETLNQMINAVKGEVSNGWGKSKELTDDFIRSREKRLKKLVEARMNKEIDDAFFDARLEDEKEILKSEFLAAKVISKAIAEKAVNAAFRVLEKAIKTAIKVI